MHATVQITPSRPIGRIDPKIYGQFLSRRRWVADEALYDPSHPQAGDDGIRQDVFDAVAGLTPSIVRWPGGCTGTSYDWREGIGPASERARIIDAHFGYDVGNGFGTAEFVRLCRRLGAEPLINLNTGTGTLRDAIEWIEYANFTTPSKFAELRRSHGHEAPLDVRYWQIGNEEWGDWEIGYRSPAEYASTAREWGKTIKKLDPDLQVLAVGAWRPSQQIAWNTAVLDEAWSHIDYLTAHVYWDFDSKAGIANYDTIAGIGYLEEQGIKAAGGLIDLMAREKRSGHRPRLAFTEWNCRDKSLGEMSPDWMPTRTQYRLVDALAVAGFLNALQRQSEIVTLAALAQTINVVGALLVTPEHVIRETIYWPLSMLRHHAGPIAVDAHVECDGYTAGFEGRSVAGIPYLDVSASLDEAGDRLCVSVVNRHPSDEIVARIRLQDIALPDTARMHRLWHEDPFAMNTIAAPHTVEPSVETIVIPSTGCEVGFLPHSYTLLELTLAST